MLKGSAVLMVGVTSLVVGVMILLGTWSGTSVGIVSGRIQYVGSVQREYAAHILTWRLDFRGSNGNEMTFYLGDANSFALDLPTGIYTVSGDVTNVTPTPATPCPGTPVTVKAGERSHVVLSCNYPLDPQEYLGLPGSIMLITLH